MHRKRMFAGLRTTDQVSRPRSGWIANVGVAAPAADELDVKAAARLAGRTAETIRRWVWSGRLSARKRGNRLMVARADVQALAGESAEPAISLREWVKLAEAALSHHTGPYRSAADLVLDERRRRLGEVDAHSGR